MSIIPESEDFEDFRIGDIKTIEDAKIAKVWLDELLSETFRELHEAQLERPYPAHDIALLKLDIATLKPLTKAVGAIHHKMWTEAGEQRHAERNARIAAGNPTLDDLRIQAEYIARTAKARNAEAARQEVIDARAEKTRRHEELLAAHRQAKEARIVMKQRCDDNFNARFVKMVIQKHGLTVFEAIKEAVLEKYADLTVIQSSARDGDVNASDDAAGKR